MERKVTVMCSDAIDEVMALADTQTAAFVLPEVTGGAQVRVYDTAAKGTQYTCDYAPRVKGDFVIHRDERERDKVRIVATPYGRLADAECVYVQTAGNFTPVEATQEIYEEEGTENA